MDSTRMTTISGDFRYGGNPLFSDNWRSLSCVPRTPKQKTSLKNAPVKELLEYRGPRRLHDNAPSIVTSSFDMAETSYDSGEKSITDDKSVSKSIFCEVCYIVECNRRATLGKPFPTATEFGPWHSHSASSDQSQCPLLYYNVCICGAAGGQSHKLSECPQMGVFAQQRNPIDG